MSLEIAFGIARSGLAAAQRGLAQTAQNIGNAETPGYTRKAVPQTALEIDTQPGGVRSGEAQRAVDAALVGRIDQARSAQAAAGLRAELLGRIEDVQGAPADAATLADGIAALENAFIGLRGSPDDAGLQRVALDAAEILAARIATIGAAIGAARQAAQDTIVQEVEAANGTLREIATLTFRLQGGVDGVEAEIEDQRDAAIGRLSESLEVRAVRQPDGGLVLIGRGVVVLPLDPTRDALGAAGAAVGTASFYGVGGTLPGVTQNGLDVTGQLAGGRLAEAIALRDETLPRIQAELDLAAATLAQRFEAQGLRLFTDTDGTVPAAGGYAGTSTLGFANRIAVNPGVAADATLLRDGTHGITATAGGPTDFTPNPAGGPAGFTTLLDRVLGFSFGTEAAAGAAWAPIQTAGIGPDGTLASRFVAPATIGDYAGRIVAGLASDRAAAAGAQADAAGMRSTLEARFARESKVDVDAELTRMVALQNAYAANAKVISTVQTAWDALLAMVR